MAATKSMLESLLARVRQRATEPRPQQAAPQQAAPQQSAPQQSALQQKAPQQKAPTFERAADPRAEVVARPAPVASPAPIASPAAMARPAPVAAVEEEIEEYDDELIEIIEDSDISSDSEPPPPSEPASAPLELRASAPSVEMRRRAVPPSSRPNNPVPTERGTPAAPPQPAASAPVAAARLRAEVVGRRPVPATAVVQSQAARPDPRSSSFLELLDASLELGQ